MKTNVLIFPAGETNSIELHDALSHNVNINIFGASSINRHGEYVFSHYYGSLPLISEEGFIDEFNKLLSLWDIDFIFPTHDSIALFLAERRNEINARVIVADVNTALICRDKKKIYDLFSDCDFCPYIYEKFDEFPVFIKPREGQGAQGASLVNKAEDIPCDILIDDYIISEYLPGEEITVDCLTDGDGKLCACLPRKRKRLLAGVCVAGETLNASQEIIHIGEIINCRLNFYGLWYFQLKMDVKGRFKLLEVSTRCAGTMCLSRARGVNLPLLSVYVAMGKKVNVFENTYNVSMDRALIARYKIDYSYDTVYIDYDDTIVNGDGICISVVSYLYQCRNQGKKIVLLTRHAADYEDSVRQSIEKHAISLNLFDEIVELGYNESKADYIIDDKSIFIDNAYAERKTVFERLSIPVFDVEGIEVLLDWRT